MVRKVTFTNHIIVSSLWAYSAQEGLATDDHLVHFGQFALRGVGLVMVEEAAAAPEGRVSPGCLGLWKGEQFAPLRRIADFTHARRVQGGDVTSALSILKVMPAEMTVGEIPTLVAAFASAVHRAFKADFDVVEIDAARVAHSPVFVARDEPAH
ncbi:NADPH dehydrogenase [Allomyces macrogynus ATCC 38327]|uniref:NADPH dehydrogenase n=1 Tax=Allomyces macrogynus (strain ATCC 38327) TaxID=578462 RepID=A0A0L0T2E8_ALLM3|nr:NADPH dehydrogenase [Allomyces macrogynus ATCC 38327]|eukprot:KNE68897.1 NADPH dehydrogenase [Allomyces macrogynus ATCC 38327]